MQPVNIQMAMSRPPAMKPPRPDELPENLHCAVDGEENRSTEGLCS